MADGQDQADLTDHDLLIRMDERVQALHACLKGHLAHHWAVTLAAVAAVAAAVVSLVLNCG